MKPVRLTPVAILAAMLCVASASAGQCCKKMDCTACIYELEVIRLVNVEREKRGIAPLSRLVELVNQCRLHSARQNAKRSMYHGSLKGCRAENVAVGQKSAKAVVRAWMNSSGHRANILSRRWQFIGAGRCGVYHTQQFK